MISFETRKLILKLILVSVLCLQRTNACDSNKKLYTEIGCKPIRTNNASSPCPVAYDCDHILTRSNKKCYFNGNVYNPRARLSESDSAIKNPCLTSCFCDRNTMTFDNETTTKFTCAHVECPRYFAPIVEPCYHQYDKDNCCEIKTNCPEQKEIVHECIYDGKTYKDGQRIYIDDYTQCVCSPEFNGTASEKTCRKIDCNYEILYNQNILKFSAPVYFEKIDGCTIDWYHPEYNTLTPENSPTVSSNSNECKYGNLNFPIGQKLTVENESDSDTYNTTCSCNIPPLLTCTKSRI